MSSPAHADQSTTSTDSLTLPEPGGKVHFVGIGGIGMSGLARILHAWGYSVSGSDSTASDVTTALMAEGIPVTIGHTDVERAGRADLVVITAAVRGENAEVRAALTAGVPIVKRAQLLGLLSDARRGVAVAGSHGKSSTSGMLVTALQSLGADPSYAVGAIVGSTGTNAAPGAGQEMVVEADEYDYSFLQLHPEFAIVTNVDYDHPDLFPDQAAYDHAFLQFVGNMRPGGALVIAADDPGAKRVLGNLPEDRAYHVVTFGQAEGADWTLAWLNDGWVAVAPDGERYPLSLQVPGAHNYRNAIAALALLVALGHEPGPAAAALGRYTGVGRRFELKGEARSVTVVDDYAHHPSEIAATIAAARDRYPGRRIWAVFQPHTFTRTAAMLDEFAEALRPADKVALLDIYAARETNTLGVSSADLAQRLGDVPVYATPEAAAEALAKSVAANDVVLTLGAGDVTATGPALLRHLRAESEKADARSANGAEAQRTLPTARARRGKTAAIETVPGYPHLRIQRDAPMSLYTTWRIGGPADALVRASTAEDLIAAVQWGREQGLPITVIGGGSNLLVDDSGIRGLVILSRTPGERAEKLVSVEDLGDSVRLRVGAQAPLSWVGRYAAEHGWAGLDWGVGLPGTIGGATVNNAGAHGTELKDHLERIVLLGEDGTIREEPAAWLEAEYRKTRIKAHPRPRPEIVVESIFVLPKGDREALLTLADDHARFRKETQPTGACAGSVFANPPGDYAGRLLEVAGLKGYQIGGARFSPKHANWIINEGNASAEDVRALIAHAQATIRERFGIELRSEVEQLRNP